MSDLNKFYRQEPALYEIDFSFEGFEWVDFRDYNQSVISFVRKSAKGEMVLVVCNFTPVPRRGYVLSVPRAGKWNEKLNSDSHFYGGSGVGNGGGAWAEPTGYRGSLRIDLPPLGVLFFKHEG